MSDDGLAISVLLTVLGPVAAAAVVMTLLLLMPQIPSERTIRGATIGGLLASFGGAVATSALWLSAPIPVELEFAPWLQMGSYEVPIVFHVDGLSVVFSALAALLTLLSAWFSSTYLHREPGYARYFVVLGLFGTGVQLVAMAGALDLFFAGWELIGLASALFIGFFKDRREPLLSAIRAFATYRACDIGFFLGLVATHELLGSTRLSVLQDAGSLPALERNVLAACFLLAALGKSAQLPFSSWLPRAMEGPTPSSALFYGGISVHTGLYLLLRTHALLDVAPVVEAVGVGLGLLTALFAALVARVQTDAKSTIAFSTLAQTGLILAEIAAGFTTLALLHLVGHALLRMSQYLRAPSTLAEAHTLLGEAPHHDAWWERALGETWRVRLYALSLHRFRLDELTETPVAWVWWCSARLANVDRALRDRLSLDREPAS